MQKGLGKFGILNCPFWESKITIDNWKTNNEWRRLSWLGKDTSGASLLHLPLGSRIGQNSMCKENIRKYLEKIHS